MTIDCRLLTLDECLDCEFSHSEKILAIWEITYGRQDARKRVVACDTHADMICRVEEKKRDRIAC